MAFTNQTSRISAVGSGAVGQEVPFPFPIIATSDLTVYKRVIATGVETELAETTNYTVVISTDEGGTVTTVTAIETTEQIHIVRNSPFTQQLDLEQGGAFNADNVENGFDKNAKLNVENKDRLDNKAITFPETDSSGLTTILPSSVDRASKNLTFDSGGNATASDSVETGSVSFTTFGENMVGSANALAGKVVINLDEQVDVTDYGATGGGTIDDTADITTAIAASSGKQLFFPSGTYNHTGLTLNQTCHFLMAPGATLFLITSSDADCLTVTAEGCLVEGGTIDGNRTNQTENSSSGIKTEADNTHIKGVSVDSCNGTGIYALYASVNNYKVEDCIVTDTFEMGIAADTTTAGTNVEIINNHIDRVGNSPTKAGILVQGESASVFITGVRITGNYVTHTADNTTNLTGITGRYLRQVVCSNNNVLGGNIGISIDKSKDVTQTTNTVYSPFIIGIEITELSQSITANNIIDGAGVTTKGIVSSGVGTDEVRNIVIGNNITGIIGISIQAQNDPDYLTIIGNNINHDIAGASKPAIAVNNSDYFVCSMNIIKGDGTAQDGIGINNCGPGSVVGNVITNLSVQGIVIFRNDGNEQTDLIVTGNVIDSVPTPINIALSASSTIGDSVLIINNSDDDAMAYSSDIRGSINSPRRMVCNENRTVCNENRVIVN